MSSQKIALFVSEAKIKAFTGINQNVSPTDLVPHIVTVQENEIQYQIGSTFYFEFIQHIS